MGVKTFGGEKSTHQASPIQSWNRIGPCVVCASKSGAASPIFNILQTPVFVWASSAFFLCAMKRSTACLAPRARNDDGLRQKPEPVKRVGDALLLGYDLGMERLDSVG